MADSLMPVVLWLHLLIELMGQIRCLMIPEESLADHVIGLFGAIVWRLAGYYLLTNLTLVASWSHHLIC